MAQEHASDYQRLLEIGERRAAVEAELDKLYVSGTGCPTYAIVRGRCIMDSSPIDLETGCDYRGSSTFGAAILPLRPYRIRL